jgi:hypothetical protein
MRCPDRPENELPQLNVGDKGSAEQRLRGSGPADDAAARALLDEA